MEEIVLDMYPDRPFMPWRFRFSAHPRPDGGAEWFCRIGLNFASFKFLNDLLAAEEYGLKLEGQGVRFDLPRKVLRTETFDDHIEAELGGHTEFPLRGVIDSRGFEGWGPYQATVYQGGSMRPPEVPEE